MRANLTKQKKPKVLSDQQRAERKVKRAKEKEQRILEQLLNVMEGIGWSSDQILARYFDVSRQRIWVWSKEGKLPAPHKHGEATTRWLNSEVRDAERKNFLGGAAND
jgi:predicted DNA-binding transcriptional regulator AlpA